MSKQRQNDKDLCTSCVSYFRKGDISASALQNNMEVMKMPDGISDLNALERFLVTPVLPFGKIVPLIKGSQVSARGPVICVAADIQSTTDKLPRTLDSEGLLKVKLKRKMCYKGYHLYQHARPNKIRQALKFLKENHPGFSGI